MTETAVPGRLALLRASIAVVARGGLRALTYRAVAAEAGVSHGLVRHHFGTRDQLIAAALDHAVDESLRATSMFDEVTDAAGFAAGIETLAQQDGDMQAFQYELLLESRRRPELRPHAQRYYDAYREANAAALRRLGVTDAALIDAIWFALDGLVFRQVVLPEDVGPVLDRIRALVRDAASA
ncbi:TetR/AcrR family transcriptional regulator [Microbacterium luticocti]|uniref:TetR/AcrR family transcriptional regulator n=1 Tax=Microbacterium luticocti TaxID=451764 RepID=UPI00041D5F48|nr:TetR/AcrR family transcriptional regulator [Microbacterium luticocti]